MVIGLVTASRQGLEKAEQEEAERARIAALTPEQKAEERRAAEERKAAEALRAKQRLGLVWRYSESRDEMSGATVRWAIINSLNEVSFEFPYQGAQRASLQLRVHPRHGNDVLLSIERGQFLCGIDDCHVSIKFDKGQATKWRVSEPADHGTTTLFVRNYSGFVANARKASKVYVEAQFFQEGPRVFEFDVAGLEWK